LFDAIAAITDTCLVSGFHAEAPMRLESTMDKNCSESYPFKIKEVILTEQIIEGVVDDLMNNVSVPVISAKFHNTIINIIFAVVSEISKKTGLQKVVFSGGTFQNRYILENAENKLKDQGFEVFSHSKIPSNDGGIALGQMVIGAWRREMIT
jgi:hydrogenase maturation protein HypF